MVKYSLNIDFAENGALAVLKCQRCRRTWARVFLDSERDYAKDSFASWRKPIMVEHDLTHKKKV